MKKIFLGILSLTFAFTSCNSDDDNDNNSTSNLTLNLNGLEDLGASFNYEGWLLVDGVPVSTGLFTVDANGALSSTSFEVPTETITAATKFILTIEPNPDPNPEPSAQKLIAGDFNGNSANVSTATAPAVGDFSAAAGNFFLRTPTDEQSGSGNNGNDENGVWFGLPGMPPTATLELPVLPDGWIYEGWVIGDAGPLSTGTFSSVDQMDDNAGLSTSFSGTENAGPPIPGEDFFNNAPTGETFPLDIRGRTVVVTVEPVPDNSPLPFTLKPLAAVAGNETAPSFNDFALNLGSFPTGTVSR